MSLLLPLPSPFPLLFVVGTQYECPAQGRAFAWRRGAMAGQAVERRENRDLYQPPQIMRAPRSYSAEADRDPGTASPATGIATTRMSMTPAAFGKLIAGETEKWARVVKFAGLKAD
jgi:hypothetical protein